VSALAAVKRCVGIRLELKDLQKSFGKTAIIRGANLAVRPVNGSPSSDPRCGKSTLFNLISGRFGRVRAKSF